MTYREVVILIPSHSLEDFPTDLGDGPAASLLNSFSAAWHPALLAMTEVIPTWHRADDPPDDFDGRLIFVPTAVDDQLPPGWIDRARDEGAAIVSGTHDRQEMLHAALVPLLSLVPDEGEKTEESLDADGSDGDSDAETVTTEDVTEQTASENDATEQPSDTESEDSEAVTYAESESSEIPLDADLNTELEIDSELAADCIALGTCWILLELLTRHMHHFNSYDEVFFEKTAVSAAKAIMDGDNETASQRLRACFDLLAEARERFYPVDCYLLDFCLLAPDMIGEPLNEMLKGSEPVNFLLRVADAEEINASSPDTIRLMSEAWARGTADVAGGDLQELPVPMIPLESALHDLARGREVFRRLFRREPTTWGRRRYGLSVMTPQILQKFGYHSALHFLLDDGLYPDREQSRMRWEGCDSSAVESYSRIPLAADSATTWLRFPERMGETMESDQVAALILARWPDSKSEFFADLRRVNAYAPVLGRFVTFNEFFLHADEHGGGGWGGHSDTLDYLSPFFVQAVARRETRPISRFVQHTLRCARFEAAAWQANMASALMGQPVDDEALATAYDTLNAAGPDVYETDHEDPQGKLDAAELVVANTAESAGKALTRVIMHGAESQPGWLCVNPLSFTRRVVVDLPKGTAPPAVAGPVKAVQFDDSRRQALVEIPAAGFAWFPESDGIAKSPATTTPLASDGHLQNEFFEVYISDVTGGLQRIKKHGRQPNRLSQQLAYRFARELKFKRRISEDEVEEISTWYSDMRCASIEVTCSGPSMGEIVTTGHLVDPSTETALAEFRQTFRIWRGRPFLEVEMELDTQKNPDGDPWSCMYAARWAWSDSSASISQSICGAAQPIQMQRIETSEFIELASSDTDRTTILPVGQPFHRKTGPRMIDSLLVVEGEPERSFRFVIGIDQHFPMQSALDSLSSVVPIRTETGPPRAGQTGWFYHVDARCVQVTRISGLKSEPIDPEDAAYDPDQVETPPSGNGFALRLQETEGRYQSTNIELFRTPTSARVRDFRGHTIGTAEASADGVRVELGPFAIVDVEIRFD